MTELINTHGLIKRFGDITAVNGISLSVKRGEVLGFLGPNGAGKSTTMKMITGFLAPDEGAVSVNGVDMLVDPIQAKRSIGYLPEGAPAYGDMTARSFLKFIAEVRGFDGADRDRKVDAVRDRTGLAGVMNQRVETLSKGYKRRVGLAQAILHDPEVLILDEPTDGLDPNQKYHVRTLIEEMAAQKAIVVSTHILEEVEAICSRVILIARGQVVADATPEALIARAPDHNAVRVATTVERVEDLRAALETAPEIMALRRLPDDGGVAALLATPKGGAPISAVIANLLRAKPDIPIAEIRTERGRLDDVFRIMTSEAAADRGEAA
ncbi:MAG: ABC transporter ATP-binding protein [Pseudomonadota bacterium]